MTADTVGVRRILTERQNNRCCYCECILLPTNAQWRKVIHPRSQTIEHLHRKADGGGGHRDNKALACYECNTGRGSIDWLTYKSIKMGEIVT
ncbi:HNH endonuclease [Rhizobium sp. 768_B6_N1_8]|uniref:HNH endonuclease n=1 Tax=unclassified Rhizobium TaxID=2613769 RepID=UPI003F23056C